MPDLEAAKQYFLDALAAHQAADYVRAESLLRKALEIVPDRVSVLTNLSAVLLESGRIDEALTYSERAAGLEPGGADLWYRLAELCEKQDKPREALVHRTRGHVIEHADADAHSDHGFALLSAGRAAEALDHIEKAVVLDDRSVRAWTNRGLVLTELRRFRESEQAFDRAIALDPRCAASLSGKASVLLAENRLEEALESADRALAIEARDPRIWFTHGAILNALGRPDEAVSSLDKALGIEPRYADAWCNRGMAMGRIARHEEALASYDRALDIHPRHALSLTNRGVELRALGRPEDALASLEMAIDCDPGIAEAWYNRGVLLSDFRRFAEALASYDRALALKTHIDYALGSRFHAAMMLCDWRGLAEVLGKIERGLELGHKVSQPVILLLSPLLARLQRRSAETFVAERHGRRMVGPAVSSTPPQTGSRLRVGYLSGDLRNHPVGIQALALARYHDRRNVEAIGFSLLRVENDPYQDAIRKSFDAFYDLSALSPADAVKLVRQRELDVAVDLHGHMQGSRMEILAEGVAPIQVNFLCPGTSGAPFIDYILSDATTIPSAQRDGYTENLALLPDSFFVNDYRSMKPSATRTRAEEGLPESGFVFASFCESYKITPDIWEVWMRLLRNLPDSVLWLGIRSNAAALENLKREAAAWGVSPERLVMAKFAERREDHIARLALADICLDTPVYNGHTTTADALWAGVPVLTSPGNAFCGRVAASILNAIGLPELIAADLPEYEAMALRLAQMPGELAGLRAKLARNRDTQPLFDTERSVRHVEAAFRMMVERQRKGLPPESFAVEPIARAARKID